MKKEACPFRVGDVVLYMPSPRGLSLDANCPDEHKLQIGKAYRVQIITDGLYVTVEGYDHSGGGIYWTEFRAKDTS